MSYKLFLDDVRRPETTYFYMGLPVFKEPDWIIVRDYNEFISSIEKNGIPEVIAFDHDLADVHYKRQVFNYNDEDVERTGYHCAKWFIDYCMDNNLELPYEIIIHSMNPYGSESIKSLFNTYFKVYNIEHNPIKMNPYFKQ